jgi:hypothetical protein
MNRRTELLLLVGILVAATFVIYRQYIKPPVSAPVSFQVQHVSPVPYPRQKPGRNLNPMAGVVFPITVAQALAKSSSDFELQPDKRFLTALSVVNTFPNTAQIPDKAEFKDGQWQITNDKGTFGNLPAYPDFTDAMQLLRGAAKQRLGTTVQTCNAQTSVELAEQSVAFNDNSLLSALNTLNHRFHGETLQGSELWLAAQALSRLAYLVEDTTYTTDGLSAKAMALVALAETACGKNMPKEESLLAAHMGYTGAAEHVAQELPASDPWRLYFTKDVGQLAKLALHDPASSEAGYFWLRRLGDLDLKQQWQLWFKQHYGNQLHALYALATVLPFTGCDCTSDYVQELPRQLLPAMLGSYSPSIDQDDLTSAPTRVIKDFDAATSHLRSTYGGPYLTADDAITYYRGYLYSGLYSWAVYLLDYQDSIEDAAAYRDLFKTAPDDIGKEMYQWMNVKLQFKQMGIPLRSVLQDMQTSRALSADLYMDDMEIASARSNWGSPEARQAARELNTLLDTRPFFRQDYGEVLKANMALPEFEDAERSLASQENPKAPNFKLWQYYFDDDDGGLLRVAMDRGMDRDVRLVALAYLGDSKGVERQVRNAYADIVHSNPGYGYACKQYLRYLSRIKDYADTEQAARYCLKTLVANDTGFSAQDTVVQLADAQLHVGKKNEAWETIASTLYVPQQKTGPYQREIADYYGAVLAEGAKVALARGDFGTAEYLANTLAERYPDAIDDQAPYLRVLWKEGRYQDAEQFLVNLKVPLLYAAWVTVVGKTFTEVFDHDPKGARKAFLALTHGKGKYEGVPGIGSGPLVFIVTAVGNYGAPGLAFDLKRLIAMPETPDMFPDQLSDYDLLKNAKGTAIAIRWLTKHTPTPTPQDLDRRISLMYTEGEMELLWSPIADPNKVGDPDMLWLYRAAAYVQHYPITGSEITQLKEHFSKAGETWHEYLGKYLMGQVDEQDIMNRELDAQLLFEANYYVALHRLSEDKYREAEELLSETMNTPQAGMWSFFSANLLGYWENAQSLPILEKKGILFHSKNDSVEDSQ